MIESKLLERASMATTPFWNEETREWRHYPRPTTEEIAELAELGWQMDTVGYESARARGA